MNPKKIKIKKLFSTLFSIDNNVKNAIKENMELYGYDKSKPIDIWNDICIDGHTRLQAAKEVGIDVEIFEHNFKNEDEALEYAIRNQRNRRNLTQEELVRCISVLDRRKSWGGVRSKAPTGALKTAEKTAKVIGTSSRTVERVRSIMDYGDEKTKEAVKTGEISISKAYKGTQERKREIKSKSVFNRTNDKVEWASWTWNPVVGCKHGCEYCYARDIANKNYGHFKPTFFENRLNCPDNTKPLEDNGQGGRSVFVCSMADLFGAWVPKKWINNVLDVVKKSPKWTFIFLTKAPEGLVGIDFPDNAWVGATVDTQARVKRTEKAFKKVNAKVKFVSCEPLLEEIIFDEINIFDWVIIGGRSKNSKMEEFQPKWEWVESLLKQAKKGRCMVYCKPNLRIMIKEYPKCAKLA